MNDSKSVTALMIAVILLLGIVMYCIVEIKETKERLLEIQDAQFKLNESNASIVELNGKLLDMNEKLLLQIEEVCNEN